MPGVFAKVSLLLSIIFLVVVVLAVALGGHTAEGWQINIASRANDGLWHLALMDIDRRLTSEVFLPVEMRSPPLFSPDGRFMVWDDMNTMQLMRLDNRDALIQMPGGVPQVWSADSRYFAFTRNGPGRLVFRTYVVELDEDGNPINTTPITLNGEDILRGTPSWSPDGERLAFLAFNDINSELLLTNADGTQPQRLVPTVNSVQTMAWSPYGERIAFAWQPADDQTTTLLSRVHVDGTGLEIIADGLSQWIAFMSWSPDGRYIAFASSPVFQSGLFVVEVETAEITGPLDAGLAAREARWSPDSERLVFLSGRDNDFYVVRRDGRNIHRLTNTNRFNVLMP